MLALSATAISFRTALTCASSLRKSAVLGLEQGSSQRLGGGLELGGEALEQGEPGRLLRDRSAQELHPGVEVNPARLERLRASGGVI